MKIKYLVLFMLLSFIAFTAFRSPATFKLVAKIPLDGGSFTTDNLQNIYVYQADILKKYSAAGILLSSHSDKAYGSITSVDVYDPMKVMVFYKDFPAIVYLDNTLSQNGNTFNTGDMGFPLTSLACVSHDNGLWLYDAQISQLVRFDVNLTALQKTGNLNQLLGIPLNPISLMEYNNYVYVNDTAQGILVFDAFGTYYKTMPFTGVKHYEIRGDDVFYMQKHKIHAFHMKTVSEDIIAQPDSLATQARVEKNLLYEKYMDTVRVYEIR
ncbi:MAG TPA: hypothetical protein VK890_03195 [Bacteroidia bacterium]|jgi:hypothetical protein|nr:hypothetical protein [Bacteroidia bacterium]